MSTDHLAKQLHDKATRGIALSTKERAQLEAWYAVQDQAESVLLETATAPQRLATLQTRIDTILTQLQTVTQRMQELTVQNAALRREIALLQHQLAQATTHEPA